MIKKISALMLLSAFLFSCSTSNNVVNNGIFQKRKHNNGWHFKSGTKFKANNDVANTEKKSVEKDDANSSTTLETVETANAVVISTESTKEAVFSIEQDEFTPSESSNDKAIVTNDNTVREATIKEENSQKQTNKKESKKLKKERRSNSQRGGDVALILLVILAILLPPLAVFLARGIGMEFWISLILTLLFWVPGVIYALLIVLDVI